MQTAVQSLSTPVAVTAAITGSDPRSLGAAALAAMSGQPVAIHLPAPVAPSRCELYREGAVSAYQKERIFFACISNDVALVGDAPVVLLCSAPMEFGDAAAEMATYLRAGQMMVLVDAPVGAALEVKRRLHLAGAALPVTVVETGRLFEDLSVVQQTVALRGMRDRVQVAGCTLNDTRTALSLAGNLLPGLVPCSNLLERGLACAGGFLRSALALFVVLSSGGEQPRAVSHALTPAVDLILQGLESELQSVARHYGVCLPDTSYQRTNFTCNMQSLKLRLVNEASANFVLLSQLAHSARLPVPVLDSIIELISSVTLTDVRKQGRSLEHLGLMGMNHREIAELLGA